jgi:transcriptional regulator with GAF, ATPase, and Fis domain
MPLTFQIHVEISGEPPRLFLGPRELAEGHSFLIGRLESCDIPIKVDHVSSRHGELVYQGGALTFRDLNSTNGSALLRGGERSALGEARLCDEDYLLLGNPEAPVRLRVEIHEERAAPAPSEISILAISHIGTARALEGRYGQDPRWGARLYRAARLLGASLDLRQVCEHACAATFDLLPAATNINLLLDQRPSTPQGEEEAQRRDLVPFFSVNRQGEPLHGERPSRHVLTQVLEQQAAVLICDASAMDASKSIVRSQIHSLIGAPLVIGERIVGILQVDNRDGQGLFAQDDLEALVVLAQQVALLLENARLYQRVKLAEEQLQRENRFLKKQQSRAFSAIVGQGEAMRRVFGLVERVVDTRATVLITGETGTGKELIAHAIHHQSSRADKLFVAQNCSALPEGLLESELFGHKRGAFTGADADKKGLFELADKGTIFLDEIGETTPGLQARLLRVLQESEIRAVGSMYPRKIDVRVIAATNRDLEREVREGRFREDLYYRLNVFPIHLPPLRERGEDIELLANHFVRRFCQEFNRSALSFSPEAAALMQSYRWPGNIRELQNEIQRVVIYGVPGDLILPEHLAERIGQTGDLLQRAQPTRGSLKEMIDQVERWILLETLREHDNNKTRAAAALQITREGLHKKLARHGI